MTRGVDQRREASARRAPRARLDQAGGAALAADLLASGVAVRLRVGGSSMRPLLRGGETATVVPVDPVALRRGDLLLCRGADGQLVLHRLVRATGVGADRRWWTRGDALASCDEPFAASQVLGRVALAELPLRGATRATGTDAPAWRAASRACLAAARVACTLRRWGRRLREIPAGARPAPASGAAPLDFSGENP